MTNGVHVPTWDSQEADALWTRACGKSRWLGDLDELCAFIEQIKDEDLWSFRTAQRLVLIRYARRRLVRQMQERGAAADHIQQAGHVLDTNSLTLGFARRFAEYKRPNLLLHDPDRLAKMLCRQDRPVQLIVAGKAHPHDEEGKRLVFDPLAFATHLLDEHLFSLLHEVFYSSLMAENQRRFQHMDQAIRRLERDMGELLLRRNMSRQEEITEEIEVIMLSAETLRHQ